MLSKKHRLKRELIAKVLKTGKSAYGRGVSLKYIIDPEQQSAFAFVASSKIDKKAIVRNKLKRRGRAIVFKLLPRIKKGILALVFFNKESRNMDFSSIESEIIKLFKKTDILN